MENFKVNILGIEYKVLVDQNRKDYPLLEEADDSQTLPQRKLSLRSSSMILRIGKTLTLTFGKCFATRLCMLFCMNLGLIAIPIGLEMKRSLTGLQSSFQSSRRPSKRPRRK